MPRRKSRSPRSRSPRQERSRQTGAAIRQAALEIFKSDGVRGLTTRAIAERAGVGVSSLYQYFPNRDAIVADLIRTCILPELDPQALPLSLVYGDADARVQQLPLTERLRIVHRRLQRLPLAERLRIVIDYDVRLNRHLIARFGVEDHPRYLDQVREFLGLSKSDAPSFTKLTSEGREHEMPLADPRLVDVFVWASLEMLSLIVAQPETAEISTEDLVEEMIGLLLRYLGAPSATR